MAVGQEAKRRAGIGVNNNGTPMYLALLSGYNGGEPTRAQELDTGGFSRIQIARSIDVNTGRINQTGTVVFTASAAATINGYMITDTASQESSDAALQGNLIAYGVVTQRSVSSGQAVNASGFSYVP